MRQPYVLICQTRPSHQILLHQACNALGLFNVRVVNGLVELDSCLAHGARADVLIIDHAEADGPALLARAAGSRAVVFVGRAGEQDLADEARRLGLWVLADLPWPLPIEPWRAALQRIKTVTSATHAG